MKLHLPCHLRGSLLAAMVSLACSPQLLAATVFENRTTTLAGPYTEEIVATNSQLTTALDTTITAPDTDFLETVKLTSSSLTNAANLTTSITSKANWGDAILMEEASSLTNYGKLELTASGTANSSTGLTSYKTSSVNNEEGATLEINVSSLDGVHGISLNRDSYLNNSGQINVTASATQTTGIALAYVALHNSATGVISVTSQSSGAEDWKSAQGITTGGTTIINEGRIAIDVVGKSTRSSDWGLSLSSGNYAGSPSPALHNARGATLDIRTTGASVTGIEARDKAVVTNDGYIHVEVTGHMADRSAEGIQLDGTLINNGNMDIFVTAAKDSTAASYALTASNATITNKGSMNLSVIMPGSSTAYSRALGFAASTFINASGATLTLSAEGNNNARDLIIGGSRMYQAGTLRADSVSVSTNNISSWSNRAPSTLCLLDGSDSGARTEGGTLRIEIAKYSSMQMGGTLDEQGQMTTTATGSSLRISSSLSLSGTTLTLYDNVEVKVDGSLTLSQITVSGNGSFRSAGEEVLTLHAESAIFVLDAGNSTLAAQPLTISSGDELTQTQVAPNVLYLESSLLQGAEVSGSVTFDLSHWADVIAAGDYDRVVFSAGEGVSYTPGSAVTTTWGGASYTGVATQDGELHVILKETPAVPEPTTSALALLALGSLAARRRRK